MYKVVIVDDERIIRESISKIIPWESYDFELVGVAANGIEALKIVDMFKPDLVITDMKMPVISGNQLIEKISNRYPETKFAVMSGYDDFEYVSESMKHGVKHYILKPCSVEEVVEVLKDVSATLQIKEEREIFIRKNNEKLEKIIPLVKEQFIRDFIMSKRYAEDEMAYFMKLFNIANKKVRLILLKPNSDYSFNTLFGLMNMIGKQMFNEHIYFKTIINKYVVLIIDSMSEDRIESGLTEIMASFRYITTSELVITYSDEGPLEEVSQLFVRAQEYLEFAFYFGSSCIISQKDIEEGFRVSVDEGIDSQELITSVKSGNKQLFFERVDQYFTVLVGMKTDIETFKYHCIELASAILRQSSSENHQKYIQNLLELQSCVSFEQVRESIVSLGSHVAEENYSGYVHRNSHLVETMIREIDQHIGDESFSLKVLASEIMFMNSGYLSKVFSKEIGTPFSVYLTKLRMEKSKEMIDDALAFKVYEIAEAVGMGNNPQYFSQSFKKYTGMTPSEYKNRETVTR